jgi:hypothetical protein
MMKNPSLLVLQSQHQEDRMMEIMAFLPRVSLDLDILVPASRQDLRPLRLVASLGLTMLHMVSRLVALGRLLALESHLPVPVS